MSAPSRLDARYLLCPMPVMRTQEAAQALAPGSLLEVACTDPGARDDIPAWCRINGHEVLGTVVDGAGFVVTVRIGAPT